MRCMSRMSSIHVGDTTHASLHFESWYSAYSIDGSENDMIVGC